MRRVLRVSLCSVFVASFSGGQEISSKEGWCLPAGAYVSTAQFSWNPAAAELSCATARSCDQSRDAACRNACRAAIEACYSVHPAGPPQRRLRSGGGVPGFPSDDSRGNVADAGGSDADAGGSEADADVEPPADEEGSGEDSGSGAPGDDVRCLFKWFAAFRCTADCVMQGGTVPVACGHTQFEFMTTTTAPPDDTKSYVIYPSASLKRSGRVEAVIICGAVCLSSGTVLALFAVHHSSALAVPAEDTGGSGGAAGGPAVVEPAEPVAYGPGDGGAASATGPPLLHAGSAHPRGQAAGLAQRTVNDVSGALGASALAAGIAAQIFRSPSGEHSSDGDDDDGPLGPLPGEGTPPSDVFPAISLPKPSVQSLTLPLFSPLNCSPGAYSSSGFDSQTARAAAAVSSASEFDAATLGGAASSTAAVLGDFPHLFHAAVPEGCDDEHDPALHPPPPLVLPARSRNAAAGTAAAAAER